MGHDYLMTQLRRRGIVMKALYVGSMGGLAAAKRSECDIAGIHLLDPETGEYNRPLLTPTLALIPGYRRMQGIVFRTDDRRFAGKNVADALAAALQDPGCRMVNRNAGSGTRILIDQLLGQRRPAGYAVQTKSHNAVAAAVAQHRADWGVAIASVARQYGLGFIALQEEHYDFVVPKDHLDRPAVSRFCELLENPEVRADLSAMDFQLG
jgi:putative molybdopterin biosynthesis protein